MYARINSYVLRGLTAHPVAITLHIDADGDGFRIAGISAERASALRRRLDAAIACAGFQFPPGAITVCFSTPAPGARTVEQLQFAIAVAILAASSQVAPDDLERIAFAGGLRSDGTLSFVRGALQMAEAAAADPDLDAFAVASASAPTAASAGGIDLLKLHALGAIRYLAGSARTRLRAGPRALPSLPDSAGPELSALPISESVLRAVEVAVAGDHALLLQSPGRSDAPRALARCLPSILPPLTPGEALEVLRIANSCEDTSEGVPTGRPFRAARPAAGPDVIFGEGEAPIPGEAIRAHLGVLYLSGVDRMDAELLERIWIAHAASAAMVGAPGLWMPCAFFLVASADPCPCGHLGSQWCRCTGEEVGAHRRRLIEATRRFEVLAAPVADAEGARSCEQRASSAAVRSRIIEARARQSARLGEGRVNRQMTAAAAADCGLSAEAISALNGAFPYPDQAGLRIRLARLARTIADLAGDVQVEAHQAREAISLAGVGSSTASPSSLARSAPSPHS